MTTYKRGKIILVDIAFSGSVGSKRRPAIVIGTSAFNNAGTKLIVAAITGNILPPFRPGDTLLNDWSAAGSVKPSAVRGILVTVDKSDVTRRLGALTQADLATVEANVAGIIGFTATTP